MLTNYVYILMKIHIAVTGKTVFRGIATLSTIIIKRGLVGRQENGFWSQNHKSSIYNF